MCLKLKIPNKKHKYGAKKCIVTTDGTIFETDELQRFNITDIEGIKFDSKSEARFYLHILDRQKQGHYKLDEIHPKFILQDKPKIKYIADFLISYPNGQRFAVDVKGVQTAAFRIKMRMFQAKFPDIGLMIVKSVGKLWDIKEVGA
jgi:hypothetical protein